MSETSKSLVMHSLQSAGYRDLMSFDQQYVQQHLQSTNRVCWSVIWRVVENEACIFKWHIPKVKRSESLFTKTEVSTYVESIQDMYEGARTSVRSAAGLTEDFEVRVGLHQGSALSPFLFAIIVDVLTKDVRKEAPWDMMFADDVVLCREDKEKLEVSLERWRKVFEERGLRVSRKDGISSSRSRARNGVHTGGDGEEGWSL